MLKAIIILFIIIGISFLPLKIYFRFYKKPNEVTLDILIKVWVFPFKMKLNNVVSKTFWALSKDGFWKRKAPNDLKANEIPWKRLILRLLIVHDVFDSIISRITNTLDAIGKKIRIKKLNISTAIALQDATYTGIAIGLLWCVWGITYNKLEQFFDMSKVKNKVKITPVYDKQYLLTIDVSCIFELALGHIIIIVYYLFINARKIRILLRRVSN
ncbi:MAG: DUF2953 domain-containing protein [Clostridia bacterium]|nr:DUF2953 domain-containing protein [Clostridia bacterium]